MWRLATVVADARGFRLARANEDLSSRTEEQASSLEETAASMEELFQKTFGLKLVRESPYTLAARLGLNSAQEGAWESLDATTLLRAESA